MIVRSALLAPLAMTLAACVAQPPSLYQWGAYEELLYQAYKDPVAVEAMRTKLVAHIAEMEVGSRKIAPGLYAELGTLYLLAGSADQAVAHYEKERDAWPESRGLMTSLIDNLRRREQIEKETGK
ncbi:MAG: DUF4810 domain-containing protein [Candidatus Accumulibacter sp.]|uniref:DUF4810 domain-containing protein n=1 Tax=Accumulibacter sp. TaxID=2053492 RepID=UPI00287A98DB|nr:DUF4810 domain-containing protein [Accumulibacter sp.]MDS4013400.1 DUF4810 domain-containing protein [Accumulibacter sp.]